MTRPRSTLIDTNATPYYHCIARCVRRAFLCGEDPFSGRNFDHRKQWLVERIALLGKVFAIDIAAYVVMSNHYHLVLHVSHPRAAAWPEQEVMERWLRLYRGPVLVQRYRSGLLQTPAEITQARRIIATWRDRLASISWFMAQLNEQIARAANQEDNCTGRFWEGRFKSQALLDDAAVLSCMAYVDLNPVRAGVAGSLEDSDFTSIQARLQEIQSTPAAVESSQPCLMPFVESEQAARTFAALPFNLKEYVELVDWTGRAVRQDKRGRIASGSPKALTRLGISDEQWLVLALAIQKRSVAMLAGLEQLDRVERRQRTLAA